MSRSYLAVRHLLRQLELKKERDSTRQIIPVWFPNFVDGLSELFEPFRGVARVGYECTRSELGWEISMFLGEHEIVGGADDGRSHGVNFRFDVKRVSDFFESVDSIYWNAFPNVSADGELAEEVSFLTVAGTVESSPVQLQIHPSPPLAVGPAMRKYTDGRVELI